MKKEYEPSADFVDKVMARVYLLEARKVTLREHLFTSRPIRYVLAGGGTILGILNAAPVF